MWPPVFYPPFPLPGRLAPALEQSFEVKALARSEAELARIEGDYDGWVAAGHRRAILRVAQAAPIRKSLALLHKRLSGPASDNVKAVLDAAQAAKDLPRSLPLPKPADKSFADFGFKLLVIEELMYRQEVLRPKFDLSVFAGEHLERHIDVDVDGYAPIPEVVAYFKGLPVPAALLAKVTSLHQSSGLDGGPRFMQHFHRFWDPGAGDVPVPVTAKAAKDLALVPNLTRISGLENSAPKGPLLKAFGAAGIKVVPEDAA